MSPAERFKGGAIARRRQFSHGHGPVNSQVLRDEVSPDLPHQPTSQTGYVESRRLGGLKLPGAQREAFKYRTPEHPLVTCRALGG